MSPQLSVVIPVYNGSKKIRKTAKQILDQDFKDIELILVENGSSDNSWEVCKSIQSSDSRVKAIQSEKGTSMARKAGVLESKGDYIVFSDQDDCYVNKHALSCIILEAESTGADIVQFNKIINSFGRKRIVGAQKNFDIDRNELLEKYVGGIFGAYEADISTCVWDKIYKGMLIKEAVKGINASLCRGEDMYLNTFVFLHEGVNRIAFSTNAYYIWNTVFGTSSSKDGGTALFEEYRIIKPTILHLAQKAGVGYEPIMRTHRETLNFLNGLIQQSILSGQTKNETIHMLQEYATWDFVIEAAHFFEGVQPDGTEWDDHIKHRADIWNANEYYNRVLSEIGNVKVKKVKFKVKRMVKDSLRWLDRI